MRGIIFTVALVGVALMANHVLGQDAPAKKSQKKSNGVVSFKKDIFPVIEKKCLPCHAEENFNPSELSLDSYELMKQGGKHGDPFVPGKSKESIVIQKLSEEPPFGDRMPLNTKKDVKAGKAKWLSPEEVKIIAEWIDQGAKDN